MNYYYPSKIENNYFSIPSKLLYSLWDRGFDLIIEGDGMNKSVLTKDYKDFICNEKEEFRIARFKPENKGTTLDNFRYKLLFEYKIHHEWYNELFNIWISDEFLVPLRKSVELRKIKEITPPKDQQFNFFKNRIQDTILPQSITSHSDDLWLLFINKCKEIQENYVQNNNS